MAQHRRYSAETITPKAEALGSVIDIVSRAAGSRTSILIVGEDHAAALLARAIHLTSPRSWGPFIRVNCAEMAPSLLMAELFGGPTQQDADKVPIGRVGEAHLGTLLLQRIDAADLPAQVKLAEVLQDHKYRRPSDDTSIPADVRLIATAERSLEPLAASGQFRGDLFYLLNVVMIVLPPAITAREDITDVIDFFRVRARLLARYPAAKHRRSRHSSPAQGWSTQILALESSLGRLLGERPGLAAEAMLPALIQTWNSPAAAVPAVPQVQSAALDRILRNCVTRMVPTGGEPFESLVLRLQKALIEQVLKEVGGAQAKAAELLGISPNALNHKMRELGLL